MGSAELTVTGCCFCHLQPALTAFHVPSGEITHPVETRDSSTEHFCVPGPWRLPIIALDV